VGDSSLRDASDSPSSDSSDINTNPLDSSDAEAATDDAETSTFDADAADAEAATSDAGDAETSAIDADAGDALASDSDAGDAKTPDGDAGDVVASDVAKIDAADSDSTPSSDATTDTVSVGDAGKISRSSCATSTNATDLSCAVGSTTVSCCQALTVPAGTFDRGDQSSTPATIGAFSLDELEVTVGRFRRFVDRWRNHEWRPQVATGAPPNGAGWSSDWVSYVDLAAPEIGLGPLTCDVDNATWSETVGNIENDPINCVNWYEAFAFCVWDGGRLPTEAEWEFAAAGGAAQRVYPWGNNAPPSTAYAAWSPDFLYPVGSHTAGAGLWGHQDLAGNIAELVYDVYAPYPTTCADCATGFGTGTSDSNPSDAAVSVVNRGGSFLTSMASLQTAARAYAEPLARSAGVGFRCAR
jgi:formylglycine-generating enzyme required for sulfatase activity